jgi:alanine dehydrogenase
MSKVVDLKTKKLSFKRDTYTYKLDCFRTTNMSIDTRVFKNDEFIQNENIPFAQLPKELKKIVKPNKK